jgi:hypothetical protein
MLPVIVTVRTALIILFFSRLYNTIPRTINKDSLAAQRHILPPYFLKNDVPSISCTTRISTFLCLLYKFSFPFIWFVSMDFSSPSSSGCMLIPRDVLVYFCLLYLYFFHFNVHFPKILFSLLIFHIDEGKDNPAFVPIQFSDKFFCLSSL